MNLQELRIGNLINYTGNYKFNGVFDRDFARYMFDVNDEWDFIEPIPLTEEWLRKNTMIQEYDTDGIDIDIYDSILILGGQYLIGHDKEADSWEFVKEQTESFDDSTFLSAISAPMQFVHTFQNYYPAITGEELML